MNPTGPTLRDVTLRDRLQLTGKALTTDRKSSWRVNCSALASRV
jgi:hypothetical protein